MAPDRGSDVSSQGPQYPAITDDGVIQQASDYETPSHFLDHDGAEEDDNDVREEAGRFLAEHADEKQNFTARGVFVGLGIGVIICFSNTYFGLQTGWVSGMAMPAALIGFSFFKSISNYLSYPFTPVENVLIQTVAGAVGTMPLGCGFVGVLPALNFLLKPEENGPLVLGTEKLMIWAVGICFFGVFIAVPLRREVIIREKLKFPSGTATALMIGVLHGNTDENGDGKKENPMETFRRRSGDMLRPSRTRDSLVQENENSSIAMTDAPDREVDHRDNWKAKIKLLILAFAASAVYVRMSITLICVV